MNRKGGGEGVADEGNQGGERERGGEGEEWVGEG